MEFDKDVPYVDFSAIGSKAGTGGAGPIRD